MSTTAPETSTSTTATAQTGTLTTSSSSPVYFWREYDQNYDFLSQWYPSPFIAPSSFCPTPSFSPPASTSSPSTSSTANSITFQTTEQYMMYRKALLFSDPSTATAILREPEPKKQKALGRKVANFNRQEWDTWKECIVEEGNWYKFTSPKESVIGGEGKWGRTSVEKVPSLAKKLLETGERELVEASPYDRVWGIGYGAADAEDSREFWGENLLGKALMRVRDRLRGEAGGDVEGGEGGLGRGVGER